MNLYIGIRSEDEHRVITPRGELDLVSQGRLKQAIEDLVVAGHVNLIVDLDHTTFMDSTGLGALIAGRRSTHAFKGSFGIVCTQERLLRLFRMTSLEKVFDIGDSVASLVRDRGSARA